MEKLFRDVEENHIICPKCGKDIGASEYCSNCNTYVNTEKKTFNNRILYIIAGIVIFIIIVIIFGSIQSKQVQKEKANAAYMTMQKAFEEKNYSSVLDSIQEFNKKYSSDVDISAKVEQLYNDVEEKMYAEISAKVDKENVEIICDNYLHYYPEGKYVEEVNLILAPINLENAKKAISDGDVLKADELLNEVIQTNSQYSKEAKKLSDSISELVNLETPQYLSVKELLSGGTKYMEQRVQVSNKLLVTGIDREREMLVTVPIIGDDVDYSFGIEIYYGNLSDSDRWGQTSISYDDPIKINVDGRYRIYANKTNTGYIEAESITNAY